MTLDLSIAEPETSDRTAATAGYSYETSDDSARSNAVANK